jgi:hypothetical protein
MSHAPHGIQVAGVAQKMTSILAFSCPANYRCGGPSYAAQVAIDAIMHIMGVGVPILQNKRLSDTDAIEQHIKENAVCGPSMLKAFVNHKSQILGGALHTTVANLRTGELRECDEVTEKAMLMLVEWFLHKSGRTKEEFFKKLDGGNDQLIELDKTATTL